MISNREHFRVLLRAEREHSNLLAAIAAAIGLYTYRELERRQKLRESEDAARRSYVDLELAELHSIALKATSRAEGVAEAEKARRERSEQSWKPREHLVLIIGSVVSVLGLVAIGLAYNLFG